MITKDELAAMIAALESQPHLSIKEEKYLAVCKELRGYKDDFGDYEDEYVELPAEVDTPEKFREWVLNYETRL